MKSSPLGLVLATVATASAAVLPSGKIFTYLPYITIVKGSYIAESAVSLVDELHSMSDVNVDHHFNHIFSGASISVSGNVNAKHLANVPGIKHV